MMVVIVLEVNSERKTVLFISCCNRFQWSLLLLYKTLIFNWTTVLCTKTTCDGRSRVVLFRTTNFWYYLYYSFIKTRWENVFWIRFKFTTFEAMNSRAQLLMYPSNSLFHFNQFWLNCYNWVNVYTFRYTLLSYQFLYLKFIN